jgi:hypothetical protein
MFVVLPFPRTEHQQGFALKEYPVAADTKLWRAAVVVAVTDAIGQLAARGQITQQAFDDERLGVFNAQAAGDDAALMDYLKQYCPTDPHVESYPGADHQTKTLP